MKTSISTRPRVLIVIRSILIYKKKILLIQRCKDGHYEPRKWEIPGGKLDRGQDIFNAAERELIEEVGILGQPLSRLAFIESDTDKSKKYKGLPYLRITSIYRANTNKVRLSNEHDSYKWISFEDALTEDITDYTRKSLLAWEKELSEILTN